MELVVSLKIQCYHAGGKTDDKCNHPVAILGSALCLFRGVGKQYTSVCVWVGQVARMEYLKNALKLW
jgi:hypothetical protein